MSQVEWYSSSHVRSMFSHVRLSVPNLLAGLFLSALSPTTVMRSSIWLVYGLSTCASAWFLYLGQPSSFSCIGELYADMPSIGNVHVDPPRSSHVRSVLSHVYSSWSLHLANAPISISLGNTSMYCVLIFIDLALNISYISMVTLYFPAYGRKCGRS